MLSLISSDLIATSKFLLIYQFLKIYLDSPGLKENDCLPRVKPTMKSFSRSLRKAGFLTMRLSSGSA